jgi:hypothetical protein
MRSFRFDWRWLALFGFVIVLANAASIPPLVTALVLALAGGYLLRSGWAAWVRSGGAPSRTRVTYWRGQRYEVGPARRGPALPDLRGVGPAVLPLLIGGALLLAALGVALQGVGL